MSLTDRGFPLMLTFDLDGETMWTSRDPAAAKRPILLSQGAYGWKTGVPRILEVLRRYDIKSAFFVPGLTVEQRPHVIEKIVEAGHEIAHHSYSHAWIVNLTHEQEREEMEKGFEAMKRATGKAPRGYIRRTSTTAKRHICSKSTGREARSSSYRSVGRSSMLPTSNIRSRSRAAPCIHRQRCWRRGRQSSTCSIQKI
jgi:peptidoglycan/xylan/chitin deacetylase (PgdA/CDA1 family)